MWNLKYSEWLLWRLLATKWHQSPEQAEVWWPPGTLPRETSSSQMAPPSLGPAQGEQINYLVRKTSFFHLRSPPSCVVCLKLISPSPNNVCPKCALLVCSKNCSNRWQQMNTKTTFNVCYSEDHDIECNILSIIRAKMKRNKGGEKLYKDFLPILNSAVTTLRMISLKWR